MSSASRTPQKWALLVGANFYMTGNARRDASGFVLHYPSLGGCVNDVALVECFLKAEVGVRDDHIIKLTSTAALDSSQNRPREPPAAWPTYENIYRAFQTIVQIAKRGDAVFFHYSGHGGRVRTIYEGVKGKDGFDEALVPVDIEVQDGRNQGRYIRDLELAAWLRQLVNKGLRLTVVLDSCHAGSSHRAVRDNVRGTGHEDLCVLPSDTEQLTSHDLPDFPEGSRSAKMTKSWLLEASGYTLFAACSAHEKASEHQFAERKHGALTYFLIDALRSEGFIRPSLLMRRVSAQVRSRFPNQTPVVDGLDDASLFGISTTLLAGPTVRVLSVNFTEQRVELDHGDLHGVGVGAVYGILPDGETAADGNAVKVQVTNALGIKSVAKILDTTERARVTAKVGCRATLLIQAPEKQTLVAMVPPSNSSPAYKNAAWREDIRRHVAKDSSAPQLWRLLPDDDVESAALFITVAKNGCYEIWDTAQLPLGNIPSIRAADPTAAQTLSSCITHLVKFQRVQRLAPVRLSTTKSLCRFELAGKSNVAPQDDPSDFSHDLVFPNGLEPVREQSGVVTVTEGEFIALTFENTSTVPVYFALFDLQPTWGIDKVYPSEGGDSECVQPGQKLHLPIQMEIPESVVDRQGRGISDTLKAIVTTKSTSLSVLELPEFDKYTRRAGDATNFSSALDQLLEELSPYRHVRIRRQGPADNMSWEVHDIVVRTVARG